MIDWSRNKPWSLMLIIILAVCVVYSFGMNNQLVFDDYRLDDGTILDSYKSFFDIKQRFISYGTFYWVDFLFGEGLWKQRLINLFFHCLVVISLFIFYRRIINIFYFEELKEKNINLPLCLGVGFFALNPVAVYSVAYLMQRSMLMATFFAVGSILFFVFALEKNKIYYWVLALIFYFFAVFSKEHAFLILFLFPLIFVLLRNPSLKSVVISFFIIVPLLTVVIFFLYGIYGHFLGKSFDATSMAYVEQLESINKNIKDQVYFLSVLNEAKLFFAYGLLWVAPIVNFMSIDVRPSFPLELKSVFNLFWFFLFLSSFIVLLFLFFKKSGKLKLLFFFLITPFILYLTEFATVWIQDPFVLYRSYLWAIAIPGILFFVFLNFSERFNLYIFVIGFCVLSVLAVERIYSFKNAEIVWQDAASKIDLNSGPEHVGRHRAFLNLGAEQAKKGFYEKAIVNFLTAEKLGDPKGNALFNIGSILNQQKRYDEAISYFELALKKGYSGGSLHYQMAEVHLNKGNIEIAFNGYGKVIDDNSEIINDEDLSTVKYDSYLKRGELAIMLRNFDIAKNDFLKVIEKNPKSTRALVGLSLSLVGLNELDKAFDIANRLVNSNPSAPALYARAMVHHGKGDIDASLDDMRNAIKLDPNNKNYQIIIDRIKKSEH